MTPGTRQHAVLADHTYDREGDLALRARRKETVDLDGVAYDLLKHVDNPRTGYQGTVYQQLDTGAIVVAHRGTEFDREPFRDGFADAGMAMARHNVQIKDAVELTRWAVDHARRERVISERCHEAPRQPACRTLQRADRDQMFQTTNEVAMMQAPPCRREAGPARCGSLLLATILLSSTVACGATMNETSKPDYRENPAPERIHGIEVSIEDAPGEFRYVQGAMQFDVKNPICLPPPDANPGGHTSPVPTRTIPFALKRGDDGIYRGTVVADGMTDEDYHGRGVCHWALVNVQVQFKATGAEGETLFIADLDGDEAVIGGRTEIYFRKILYPRHPRSTTVDPFVIGRAGRAAMAHLRDDELFKVRLSATEATP